MGVADWGGTCCSLDEPPMSARRSCCGGDAKRCDGSAERGEAAVIVSVGGAAPAQPDSDHLGAAVAAEDPYGASGVTAAAGGHTGGEVLVITVGGGDRAALLAGGGAGSAHGLAWPGPRVVVCRYGVLPTNRSARVCGPKSTSP